MPTKSIPKRPRGKVTWDLDCSRLQEVDARAVVTTAKRPEIAYVDRERGWVVQVFDDRTPSCDGTPWEGTLQVSVKHTRARTIREYEKRSSGIPITWDELQAIKDHFWPGRIALEVYPPHNFIVNVADMRWLWVLPPGAVLPFDLRGGKDVLTSS